MSRTHLAVALTQAAIKDTARMVAAVAQWVLLDPALCRILGHTPQALYDDDGGKVLVLCIRCQEELPDAR